MTENQPNKMPYFAEQGRLEQCLELLSPRPLKLIVSELWDKGAVTEMPWERPAWDFSDEGGHLKKPVFLNPRDNFQFSVASASSRQEWHYHERVLEIYVSTAPITIEYRPNRESEQTQRARIESGFLIVPPGLAHTVELSGTTYVFQAVVDGEGLSADKVAV